MPGKQLLMTFPVTATSHTLADYRARGGYGTLQKVLATMKPEQVTKEVAASGILGHGGAAFPAGRKWQVVHLDDGQPHYLCANADEGEPGTFKDRWILEHNPHVLLESMLISSYALQVRNAFVYIRGEFDLPYRRLAAAVEEAYEAGYFGERILGSGFACDIVVYRGAGSYVCGEASGLITSIEGKRGYPLKKFLYEDCGGILGGAGLKCIIPGGISTKVLTAAEVEPLTYDKASLEGAGSSIGSGGMVVIAEGTCMVRLLQVMLRFYHHESCGQCTPCREGMGWLHRIIDRIIAGGGRPEDIEMMYRISHANDGTTICGMGDAAGYATVGILNKYRDEFEYWIEHGRSKFGGNLEVIGHA
jgi:NADH:ubiquinone oxidoreductase subunit F (NADH-binding)